MAVEGRTALGILADANGDPLARWQSIAYRIQGYGHDLPSRTALGGIVIEGNPRIGVWLMPDNSASGELEDFVQRMIPEQDPVWPRSERYVNSIPKEERKFKTRKIQRARIHAWLATRREPRKMGAAISARDLDINAPIARDFIAWIRQLFR